MNPAGKSLRNFAVLPNKQVLSVRPAAQIKQPAKCLPLRAKVAAQAQGVVLVPAAHVPLVTNAQGARRTAHGAMVIKFSVSLQHKPALGVTAFGGFLFCIFRDRTVYRTIYVNLSSFYIVTRRTLSYNGGVR